ncbi:hypothetical protein SK128_019858 [Halocaridina rubra]|uniref:Ionotropic glutamate receptor L-glutamate and glycine-binding domain-containing protein n=1 Tax=Halocaridina rubra TaxID=373956 RepID=A0AAN8XBG0_HALRR
MAAEEFFPFVYLQQQDNGSTRATGSLIDVINIFAANLGFTYNVVRPPDGEWGLTLPNGSATGMIGMCIRQEVDFALGPFSITHPRSKVIDFSEPLYLDQSGIFLPRPSKTADYVSFLRPFTWELYQRGRVELLTFLRISGDLGSINPVERAPCEHQNTKLLTLLHQILFKNK